MKKILLLSDTFPPDLGVGGRRWERFCSVLCHDYEITVIAGSFDSAEESSSALAKGGVYRVVYPKMRLSNIIGTRNPRTNKNKDALDEGDNTLDDKGKGRWRIKYARLFDYLRAARELIPLLDLNRAYARKVLKLVLKKWRSTSFDLIIASCPESGNLIAANRLNKKWNIPWIAEFRDPWAESYHCPFPANTYFHNILRTFEERTIKSSSSILTINEELASLIASGNKCIDLLPTSVSGDFSVRQELDQELIKGKDEPFRLGYVGCVVDKSDYHLLGCALTQIEDGECKKVSWLHWGPNNADFPMRCDLGIENLKKINYQSLGNVTHTELIKNLRGCDYSVIFGYNGRSAKCIWSGKIFDYLSVGRPILMIGGSDDSALYKLLSKAATGYWLKDEAELRRFLLGEKLSDVASMCFEGDVKELESYSLANTSNDLKELINKILQD